jgi:hypothetical protein
MRWLSKLLGRPGESREHEAARGHQVLRDQAEAGGLPQYPPEPREPTPPEAVELGEFDPQPGDVVLAPARQNPVVKELAEVIELEQSGAQRYAKVREAGSENEPWSVHYDSLEPPPASPSESSESEPPPHSG